MPNSMPTYAELHGGQKGPYDNLPPAAPPYRETHPPRSDNAATPQDSSGSESGFTGTVPQALALPPDQFSQVQQFDLSGAPTPTPDYVTYAGPTPGVQHPVYFADDPAAQKRIVAAESAATDRMTRLNDSLKKLQLERNQLDVVQSDLRTQRKTLPTGIKLDQLKRIVEQADTVMAPGGGLTALIQKQARGQALSNSERSFLQAYGQAAQVVGQVDQLDRKLLTIPDLKRQNYNDLEAASKLSRQLPSADQARRVAIEGEAVARMTRNAKTAGSETSDQIGQLKQSLAQVRSRMKQREQEIGDATKTQGYRDAVSGAQAAFAKLVDNGLMSQAEADAAASRAGEAAVRKFRVETGLAPFDYIEQGYQQALDELMQIPAVAGSAAGSAAPARSTSNAGAPSDPSLTRDVAQLRREFPGFSDREIQKALQEAQ